MFNRSHACVALILCTSVAFAQEASTPVSSGGDSGSGSSAAPAASVDTPTVSSLKLSGSSASTTASSTSADQRPEETDSGEGFALPGGYGSAPLNFTPGQGHFDKPPFTFSTTLQQGYDDNVNNTSGSPLEAPVKGSMITNLSEGVDILLSQSRMGLSFSGNLGGQYYWENAAQQWSPNGGVNLLYAYKISPRAQFSAMINGVYTTEPSFSVINGLTESNGKGYLTSVAKFDLLYQWAPRFSTDTTYLINGTYYSDSLDKAANNISQTIGEAFRYSFSRLVMGVFEGRFMQTTYTNSINDYKSYYALTGVDLTLSRRLSTSLRVGSLTRSFDEGNASSSTMPYAEASANYVLTPSSVLGFEARYGYDDSNTFGSLGKSVRTGVSLTQAFSPKLRGTASLNYSHTDSSEYNGIVADSWSAVSGAVGVQYALSKDLTLFANYSRIQKTSPDNYIEYTKNLYYVGATYQY